MVTFSCVCERRLFLLLTCLACFPTAEGFLSATNRESVNHVHRVHQSCLGSSSSSSSTQLHVKRVKGKQPKKQFKPLHHSSRQKDPLLVEHDLLSQRSNSYNYILGSDESGTGCIAGPVVTATCCCLPGAPVLPGVLDGKRLSRAERKAIFEQLVELSEHDDPLNNLHPKHYLWTTAIRTAAEIDEAPSVKHAIMDCFQESIHEMVHMRLVDYHKSSSLHTLNQNDDQEDPNKDTFHPEDIRAYSIVDGSSSPKDLDIPSRPWPQGDNYVYSVALASIIASVIHDNLMEEATLLYPEYGFNTHKGYSTPAHILALHQYGPSPIHRASCKPLRQREGTIGHKDDLERQLIQDQDLPASSPLSNSHAMDRTAFLNFLAVGSASAVLGAYNPPNAEAMYTDTKSGIRLPDKGEIENAVPSDWSDIENPLTSDQQLARLDSSNDALFYQDARFVEHVDEGAVKLMAQYIARVWQTTQPSAVLDLCASHVSHFPPTDTSSTRSSPQRVAGLGMNAQELQANPVLTEWVVQDLNVNPQLPYSENSFDLLFCQLSIDYLTKPLQVCREMARVLKPGGSCHILFSNRLFLQKAVALWTGADDIDHTFTVASYLHFGGEPSSWESISSRDLSVRKNGRVVGDPMYVVTATKRRS